MKGISTEHHISEMSEFGLIKNRPDVPFETHLNSLNSDLREKLLELRRFVKSLGAVVIEDVRPHRIVYAKTLGFRIFLDVQPGRDGLALVIKKGRGMSDNPHLISADSDLEAIKSQISQAFLEIK